MRRTAILLSAAIGAFVLTVAVVHAVQGGGADAAALRVEPSLIQMGTFYGGKDVTISGTASRGDQVVVVIRGADVEEVLNRKARVGPIWVNEGKVHISGVPSLFLSFSARPVEQILNREAIDAHQLDEAAIRKQMHVSPEAYDQPVIRENFLKMKTNQNIYQVRAGALETGAQGPVGTPFEVAFRWSKKAPPGLYEIIAYECRDGAVTGKLSASLKVEEIGFPAWMARMAKDRAALYGAFAVVVALLAGLGIDFVASRLGKGGAVAH
jgi:uncharacterized protein (TIGR02186 family)